MKPSNLAFRLLFCLTALLICLFAFSSEMSAHSVRLKGLVKGRIIGPYDQGGPNVEILFDNNGRKHRVMSDDAGGYEIELAEGIYTITAQVSGFFPFRRAPFEVKPGSSIIINLDLWLSGSSGAHAPEREVHYKELPLLAAPDQGLKVLVQTAKRWENDEITEYEFAMVTFNSITMFAHRLTFDKKTFRFMGKEGVIVDNGQKRMHGRQADLYFLGNTPIVEVKGEDVEYIRGKGDIGDSISFEFDVKRNQFGHLTYEDRANGIALISKEVTSFSVVDDEDSIITQLAS